MNATSEIVVIDWERKGYYDAGWSSKGRIAFD